MKKICTPFKVLNPAGLSHHLLNLTRHRMGKNMKLLITVIIFFLSSIYQVKAQCPYSFTASVTQITGVSNWGCMDGSVTVRVNTSEPLQFVAMYNISGWQGIYIDYTNPEGTISGLPAGTLELYVVPYPNDNYNVQHCAIHFTNVVIPGPQYSETTTISVQDASGTDCRNGKVTYTTATNACNGFSTHILDSTGQIVPGGGTFASGSTVSRDGLRPGNYTLVIRANIANGSVNQSSYYPFTVGQAPCSLSVSNSVVPANNSNCSNGSLIVNASWNECSTYSLVVKRISDDTQVYSNVFVGSIPNREIFLDAGDYRVYIQGISPGTCSWTSEIISMGCPSQITVEAPAVTVSQQPSCITPTGSIIISSPVETGMQYSIGGAYQPSTTFSGMQPGTYQVTAMNIHGTVSPPTEIVIDPVPEIAAPLILGPINVCQYVGTGEEVEFSILPDPNITSYVWTVPGNTNIVSGQGTNTLRVTFSNDFVDMPGK
ncbi:MAG: hypothetical protein EOO89_16920, partial [Pedobacter sp.]